MGVKDSGKDFLARGKIARACALIGKQSKTLADLNDLEESLLKQLEMMKRDPNIIDPNWVLYCVKAEEVEFWQGDTDRKHIRLQYRLVENNWIQEQLWP